jgi:hypothetical protein
MSFFCGGGAMDADGPGMYIVTHDGAVVRQDKTMVSPIAGYLAAGQRVRVVEVDYDQYTKRWRGRVENPAGWMSLLEMEHGYRWARKLSHGEDQLSATHASSPYGTATSVQVPPMQQYQVPQGSSTTTAYAYGMPATQQISPPMGPRQQPPQQAYTCSGGIVPAISQQMGTAAAFPGRAVQELPQVAPQQYTSPAATAAAAYTYGGMSSANGLAVSAAPSGTAVVVAQPSAGGLPVAAIALPPRQPSFSTVAPVAAPPAGPQGTLVVALDVDEVLVSYVEGFRKFLQRERPNGPLDTHSVFNEAYDPSSYWRQQFALTGGIDQLEAVPGSVAAVSALRSAGVQLEVVTSRPPVMRQSTEALLQKLFPAGSFTACHFVGHGEKGLACQSIGALALVDDQVPNAMDALSCGVYPVLFDLGGSYPWSANQELPAGVKRVESWLEVCEYLLAVLRTVSPEIGKQKCGWLLQYFEAKREAKMVNPPVAAASPVLVANTAALAGVRRY